MMLNMKKTNILTLMLMLTVSVAFGQTFNYSLNYRNIKFGNTADGVLQFNGLATFVNGINVPLRSLSDSSDNAASTKFVKQLVQGLGSPLTFSNGLTKTGNNITLGGGYNAPVIIGSLDDAKGKIYLDEGVNALYSGNIGIGNFSNLSLVPTQATMSYGKDGIQLKSIEITENSILLRSTNGSKPAEYAAKYRSDLTNRSVMDKEYVDSVANAASASGVTSVNGRTGAVTGLAEASSLAAYQTLSNLSTDLTASATKYPSVNAVNTGLSDKSSLTSLNVFNSNNSWINTYRRTSDATFYSQAGWDSFRVNRGAAVTQYGFNLISHSISAGNNFNLTFPSSGFTGTLNAVLRPLGGTIALTSDFASGQTIGANTTGNSATTTKWGGIEADFTQFGVNLFGFLAYNEFGMGRAYSLAQIKTALGIATQARYTASGNGSSTAIVIPHGYTGISATSSVIVTANNSASAGFTFAIVDATNVTINYTVAPPSGTNNLIYSISIK